MNIREIKLNVMIRDINSRKIEGHEYKRMSMGIEEECMLFQKYGVSVTDEHEGLEVVRWLKEKRRV